MLTPQRYSDVVLIDVVMPVYGAGQYIDQAVSSYIKAKIESSRLTIVLDRPDSELLRITKKFSTDPDIRVLTSPGSGIVDALNWGIVNSNAAYIARLDSDDVMMKGRLERQLEILERDQGIVCIGSRVTLIDGDNCTIGHTRYPINYNQIKARLKYQNCVAHPSVMFRRQVEGKEVYYRKSFTGAEDYDLWLRLVKIGKIVNLKDELTKYRITEEQYSASLKKNIRSIENLCQAINSLDIIKFEFNQNLEAQEARKHFFKLIKRNFPSSPIKCSSLISVFLIGRIIDLHSKKRTKFLKISMSIPYSLLSLVFAPKIFLNFALGLIFHRTKKEKR